MTEGKKMRIERNGYIVTPFLGEILIINTHNDQRGHVEVVRDHKRHNQMVMKNDRKRIYNTGNRFYYAQDFVNSMFVHLDDRNFNAMCEHYTGGRNFYDR
jgi:hypothetical protein